MTACLLHCAHALATADKPNMVFILADDAGIGDFPNSGCPTTSTKCH